MKKLILAVFLVFPFTILAGEKYCVIGGDPVDVKRQPTSEEVIVLTKKDLPIRMKGGEGGIREYSCILPAGSPAVVSVDDINRCPKWIYRCGNPIVTSPCLGPKIFKEQHVETQVETMVIAQAPTTRRLIHPMARPCFDCGLSAPKGSWEYKMNEAIVSFASSVPIGAGIAASGYYIGDGIKNAEPNVTNINSSSSASASARAVNRATVHKPSPILAGPVPAPAPPPNVNIPAGGNPFPATAPTPTVYIPTGGSPSSAIAPPPGPLSGPLSW